MNKRQFKNSTKRFDQVEDARGKIYYRALALVEQGFVIDAHLLILATWNTAAFRYALRGFNLLDYEKTVATVSRGLRGVPNYGLLKIDLKAYRPAIVKSFEAFKKIDGVGFTGASKVLHLIRRDLFVPWDNYISGQKMRRDFKSLPVVRSGFWTSEKFERTGYGYHRFLTTCQETFRSVVFDDCKKTHAKQIDEFNFVNITVRLQTIQSEKDKAKKALRRSERLANLSIANGI